MLNLNHLNPDLTILGTLSLDFRTMAQISKLIDNIRDEKQSKLDCYSSELLPKEFIRRSMNKLKDSHGISIGEIISSEIFYPSKAYPSHIDQGGNTLMIPLASGQFTYKGSFYPVSPFAIYMYNDTEPHNSNYPALMISLKSDSE